MAGIIQTAVVLHVLKKTSAPRKKSRKKSRKLTLSQKKKKTARKLVARGYKEFRASDGRTYYWRGRSVKRISPDNGSWYTSTWRFKFVKGKPVLKYRRKRKK